MIRVALFIAVTLLAAVTLFASGARAQESQSQTKDQVVRKLVVTVDPLAAAKLQGRPGVTRADDEKEMAKTFGDDIGRQITGKIDFGKEALVHVSWGSSGPPFGDLRYEINDEKDGKAITFFIKEPKVAVRGQAYRLGNDFFAVPKKAKVKFGETRQ